MACLGALLLTAAGLAACLHLYLNLRREMTVLRRSWESASARVDEIGYAPGRCREIESRLDALEQTPPAAPSESSFLGQRSMVMRLSRRGEPVERIAATLRIPKSQVSLLLKVREMGDRRPAPLAS